MSQRNAENEAARRISKMPIPPEPEHLQGCTITLLNFETDGVAGGLVGGNSATFQSMCNKAAKKMLKARGAQVKTVTVKLDTVVRWDTDDAKPQTLVDKLVFAAEVFNAVICNHRVLPTYHDILHKELIELIKEAKHSLEGE